SLQSATAKTPPAWRGFCLGCLRSEIHAEADAERAALAAERPAERERRAADTLAIADRQAAVSALETRAHGDAPVPALRARGVDRHVQHRRTHRAHPVDVPLDVVETVLDHPQAMLELIGIEAEQLLDGQVGVAVGLLQRAGVARGDVAPERFLAAVGVGGGLRKGLRVARAGPLDRDAADPGFVQ